MKNTLRIYVRTHRAILTWLRQKFAYPAAPTHRGSTHHNIASRKTEVALASAMYS